jgi:hypothetical protein
VIQTPPPYRNPALVSALELILEVTMPGVTEKFKSVVDEMTHRPKLKVVNLSHDNNVNLIHENLNTGIDKLEKDLNILLVLYGILTSTV